MDFFSAHQSQIEKYLTKNKIAKNSIYFAFREKNDIYLKKSKKTPERLKNLYHSWFKNKLLDYESHSQKRRNMFQAKLAFALCLSHVIKSSISI